MRVARLSVACLAVVLSAALAVGACGGDSADEERIRAIIAEVAEDPSAICAHLPSEVVDAIGGREQCDALAVHADGERGDLSIEEVEVEGDVATATVTDDAGDEERIGFVREGGDWKVDEAAGG